MSNDDEDDEDDEDEEDDEQTNGRHDENLEKSIFEKLGQAQPIPPSEIPDFQARYYKI